MTSMKFCRGGRPITPGAWQTHTDHACEVAMPAGVVRVPDPDEAEGPSLPGVWTPEDLRAVVLTAGEIADAYGTDVDSLDGDDILSTRQRELLERAAQAFRAEGAEDEPVPAEALTRAAEQVEQATGADFDTAAQLAGHAMACCTSAIGPVCRHRTTPVADALQEVSYWQAKGVIVSHPSGDGELAALRRLADAVRSHGIGADLAARRKDCTDQACAEQACPEHPGHQGDEHTYEQHHSPRDHVGPGPCRCPG